MRLLFLTPRALVEARQPFEVRVRPIGEKQPGEVGFVIADVGKLPVDHGDDFEPLPVQNVRQPAVAPAQD